MGERTGRFSLCGSDINQGSSCADSQPRAFPDGLPAEEQRSQHLRDCTRLPEDLSNDGQGASMRVVPDR